MFYWYWWNLWLSLFINFLFISINENNWFAERRFLVGVHCTGTCFIQKIYAPSSSLFQGKHLPFSPSPLRLNIFRLFVILSLTQLYRYTPEIFLFSTAIFKYIYRAPPPETNWTRKVSECGLLKISVNETDTTTSGLRWIFHMHSEFSRPAMCNNVTWSSPLKCKVSL